MEQKFVVNDETLLFYMPRELDQCVVDPLKNEIEQLVNTRPVKTLVLDFEKTEFMDSSGIGMIIGRAKQMKFLGGCVVGKNINSYLQRLFHASGVWKMIEMEGEKNGAK